MGGKSWQSGLVKSALNSSDFGLGGGSCPTPTSPYPRLSRNPIVPLCLSLVSCLRVWGRLQVQFADFSVPISHCANNVSSVAAGLSQPSPAYDRSGVVGVLADIVEKACQPSHMGILNVASSIRPPWLSELRWLVNLISAFASTQSKTVEFVDPD